ncbi:MAG: T9SS type A sorting domain-containing protein [Bacteroidota bacterium]
MNSFCRLLIGLLCCCLSLPLSAQNECAIEQSLVVTATSLGSPAAGPYQPGEVVSFCYTLSRFEEVNCNWLHGIVPEFGDGWDPLSFNSSGEPQDLFTPLIHHVNGRWTWFSNGWARYNLDNPLRGYSAGEAVGAGWFFLNFDAPSNNPLNPNATYGDSQDCSQTGDTWEVCFSLTARGVYDCSNGSDATVSIHLFSDGETGAQSNPACLGDVGLTQAAEVLCCGAPELYPLSDVYHCNGETTQIPLFSTDPNATYRWEVQATNVDGAAAGTGTRIEQTLRKINPQQPAKVIYTVTPSSNGCEGLPESFEVDLSDLLANAGNDYYVCAGRYVLLNGSVESGLPPYTYQWDFGPSYARPVVGPEVTTTYVLTVTDALGCTARDEVTVYVNQTGPISGSTTICENDPAGNTYVVPAFPGAFSYTWTVPDGVSIISGQGSRILRVDWTGSAGGQICVRPNGACANILPTCIDVTVLGSPDVGALSGATIACNDLVFDYEVPGGSPFWDYQWTVTNGTLLNGQGSPAAAIQWDENETRGEIIVVVDDACGMTTQTLDVELIPAPEDTQILGNDQICRGDEAIYFTENIGSGADSYTWFVPNGAQIIAGQGTQFIRVDWGSAEGGAVCVDISNACTTLERCLDVKLYDPVTLEIAGPAEACQGGSSSYSLESSVPLDAVIIWSVPTGATLLSPPNFGRANVRWDEAITGEVCLEVATCEDTSSVCLPIVVNAALRSDTTVVLCTGGVFVYDGVSYDQTGTYEIVAPLPNGCNNILTLDLTILSNPSVSADAGPDTQVGCTVDATLGGSGTSTGPDVSYRWTDANGDPLATTASLTVSAAGTYVLTVFDAQTQCEASDTVVVTLAAPPVVGSLFASELNCFNGGQVQIDASAAPSGAGISYAWTGPNGFSSDQQNPVVNEAGQYCLMVADAQTGCVSAAACVDVVEFYAISASATPAICDEQNGTASVVVEGIAAPEYAWSNGATEATITHLDAGTYTVTVSSPNGTCTETATVEVTADLSCRVTIGGYVLDDSADQECDNDASVNPVAGVNVRLLPLDISTLTDANGYYEFEVNTGAYTLEINAPAPYYVECPASGVLQVEALDTSDVLVNNNFYLNILTNFDLRVNAITGTPVPGGNQFYELSYCNDFFQEVSGEVIFRHDPALIFDPVAAGASSYDAATATATWTFSDLSFFECEYLQFTMAVPASLAPGTEVISELLALPTTGDIQPDNNYYAWVTVVPEYGAPNINPSTEVELAPVTGGIELYPNQPNPFVDQTDLSFYLPEATDVRLGVYDLNGRLLWQRAGHLDEGRHQWTLGAEELPAAGLYLYRLEAGGQVRTAKLMRL